MRPLSFLTTGLFAAAAILPLVSAAPALAAFERTFSVSGHGEARSAPDLATLTAGVHAQASTAKEALSRNTAQMNQVFKAFKSLGIADRDLQTSNFSISPLYQQYKSGENGPQRVVGYQVSNQVNVMVRDLGRLGEALDTLVRAGANEIYGVNFGIAKPEPLQDEARKFAIKEAQRKATLMAQTAGVRLGRLVTMSESGAQRPVPVSRMSMKADAGAPVPIAAGEEALDAYVTLTYEIE